MITRHHLQEERLFDSYLAERGYVFSEKGQVAFLQMRDHIAHLLKIAGAFQMQRAFDGIKGGYGTWEAMACVDRLVELGELREISPPECAGQHRTFVLGRAGATP